MVLFINACVRRESRTRRLAQQLLHRMGEPATVVRLSEILFPVADENFLMARDALVSQGAFSHGLFDMARQFAEAERIVIASPYWDLSFPAALKQYFEQINVPGITFRYTNEGVPEGLCCAKQLFYVTTAGGTFCPEEYGFGYIKALAQQFYGIPDVRMIRAVGLDMEGADEEQILREAMDGFKL